MKKFRCVCENALFFDNTVCLNCGRATGWCPSCRNLVALLPNDDGTFCCGRQGCGTWLKLCKNAVVAEMGAIQVCNWCLSADTDDHLCPACTLTRVIPDLSVEGHCEKWARLESAKRRMVYLLDELGLSYEVFDSPDIPPLRFEFKADAEEGVVTGHANGLITINIREADDVEREKTRVQFGEAHRTLIGHFRHEVGHYYWDALVGSDEGRLARFREVFGDERDPSYSDALKTYYANGPAEDWKSKYISAYASMHPWEDFAETFGTYLDIASVLDTAAHFTATEVRTDTFEAMTAQYQSFGVTLNALNREMGLPDFVPEVFTPSTMEKLRYVDDLVRTCGNIKAPEPTFRFGRRKPAAQEPKPDIRTTKANAASEAASPTP